MAKSLPELWQTEWCPHSHEVRETLTELGVEFVAHQVAPEPEDRDDMEREVGTREIPAVRLPDGTVLTGDSEAIVDSLKTRYREPSEADVHRRKAQEKGPGQVA
jgi:glutaredoxin